MADAVENEEEEKLLRYCTKSDVEGLRRVLGESKVKVDYQDKKHGYTGLMLASLNGHVECLKLLLAANACVNCQNQDGATGVMYATMSGQTECLKLLLAANADVNVKNRHDNTGLLLASTYGMVDCLKLLLENNADVNHRSSDNLRSALTECCKYMPAEKRKKQLMRFLLLSCGAEGEEGKEFLEERKTGIAEYHTELKHVLEKKVVVDTRLYLEENGLYHEPLERVMQYCGLELMLDNDPNRDEDDPIPILLRESQGSRVRSAWYWRWRR